MRFLQSRKRKPKNADPTPFKTIQFSPHLIEYRGALPAVGKFGVRHHFYCSEVNAAQQSALLAEGFCPISGTVPTHLFLCTFALNRDAGASRCLFSFTLDLSEFSGGRRSYVAVVVARGLRRSLLDRQSPDFLIRCRNLGEFPFCVEDSLIDEFWLDWARAYYRRGLKDLIE